MRDAPAGFKRCSACNDVAADWRDRCDCGHVFFERKPVEAMRDDPGELEELIGKLDGGKQQRRKRSPETSSEPTRRKSGSAKVVLWLAFAVMVLVGIAYFPLQTLAACAVIAVLILAFR
jgi:hypothetical protein